MSSRTTIVFNVFTHFYGSSLEVNRINEGHYLRYPAILTNALVPQPTLSSILQNQLGVALDALTISPFLVIDDKLVEVFNGKEVCEIVKDSVLSS